MIERISIDEAFLDVSGSIHLFGSPATIATELRSRVAARTGLPISVGVASTKHLAKIASQVAKPDGLIVVADGLEEQFLRPLPVGLIWGVGPVTRGRLREAGITTIGELAEVRPSVLRNLVGGAAVTSWLCSPATSTPDTSPRTCGRSRSGRSRPSGDSRSPTRSSMARFGTWPTGLPAGSGPSIVQGARSRSGCDSPTYGRSRGASPCRPRCRAPPSWLPSPASSSAAPLPITRQRTRSACSPSRSPVFRTRRRSNSNSRSSSVGISPTRDRVGRCSLGGRPLGRRRPGEVREEGRRLWLLAPAVRVGPRRVPRAGGAGVIRGLRTED